jgi:hypothetical protein
MKNSDHPLQYRITSLVVASVILLILGTIFAIFGYPGITVIVWIINIICIADTDLNQQIIHQNDDE